MRALSPRNEAILPAKKGSTLKVGETLVHSRYDPEAEAEKYIASLTLTAFPFFILIEPGLDYLGPALKKQFPSSKIISLHCSAFFDKACTNPASWNPALPESLDDFLERLLGNSDASDIKLVDWKPSINAYGKAALDLAFRAVECVRRISAGKKTVRNFGRRWIRNALRNVELFTDGIEFERSSVPILVCAAGPSLEDSLDRIAAWKQSAARPFLVAVSSAAPALLYRGIMPDLIVSTDGGNWALFHLIESFRYGNAAAALDNEEPVIAAALTAALPSSLASWPLVFLRDGSLWQEVLARKAGFLPGTNFVFPQRGTVSVTALDLAFSLSGGNVYVSGLDFGHRDLLTHSRPYAFDHYTEESASRTNPRYARIFQREAMIRASGSHGIYASWLATHKTDYPNRLFTLGPSVHGIREGDPAVNETGEKTGLTLRRSRLNFKASSKHEQAFRRYLIDSLMQAIQSTDNPIASQRLCGELGELLVDEKPETEKKFARLVQNALLELV